MESKRILFICYWSEYFINISKGTRLNHNYLILNAILTNFKSNYYFKTIPETMLYITVPKSFC